MIGKQVIVESGDAFVWDGRAPTIRNRFWPKADGLLAQEIGHGYCWFVDYMKPIEDPDEQTIEQEDEVTA